MSIALMLMLLVMLFFYAVPIYFARLKGRSVIKWGVLGILFTPFITIFLIVFLPCLCPKCRKRTGIQDYKKKACPQCLYIWNNNSLSITNRLKKIKGFLIKPYLKRGPLCRELKWF